MAERAEPLTLDTAAAGQVRPSLLKGTLVGTIAVVFWSASGPLITFVPNLPRFQLIAMTFVIYFLVMLPVWLIRGEAVAAKFHMPAPVWIIGTLGPWGYTVFFFYSYRLIPPIHATLILMSWPIFLLFANALLKGRRVRWWHAAGSLVGFLGAGLLVVARNSQALGTEGGPLIGYLMALAGALVFCTYSYARSTWRAVPTDASALFCLAGAVVSAVIHPFVEPTVMPDLTGWAVILAFGLLNVAAALLAWDYGMKFGQVRTLVALTYLTPLFTTAILIAIGAGSLNAVTAGACALIVGGAFLGSRDMFTRAGRSQAAREA